MNLLKNVLPRCMDVNTCIECSFKFLLKVGVEESIVNARRVVLFHTVYFMEKYYKCFSKLRYVISCRFFKKKSNSIHKLSNLLLFTAALD
jgi:hypothetical protein